LGGGGRPKQIIGRYFTSTLRLTLAIIR